MSKEVVATDVIVFDGVNFIRYPESKNTSDKRYYKAWWRFNGKRMKTYLHRAMWMQANGEIPEGYHIHHKDGNYLNNALDNFECITAAQHISDHYHEKGEEWRAAKTHTLLTVAQEAAKEWHGTEAGREWHSQHSKGIWASKTPTAQVCTVCGKPYESIDSRKSHLKYCSINCNAKARRLSGLDDEDRECTTCGKPFRHNKYQKAVNCSKSCAAKQRESNKLAA